MKPIISGIQQIGIGVPDVDKAFAWYRRHFKTDIQVFREAAPAPFMTPYTGGEVQSRDAALALNIQGGGGFEIWQYTSRTPQSPTFTPALGDLGLFVAKIKSADIVGTHGMFLNQNAQVSDLVEDPLGRPYFFVRDLNGLTFQVVDSTDWYKRNGDLTGGAYGMSIGVSNMERSMEFYANVLGYDAIAYDEEGIFDDLAYLEGGEKILRRVLLGHSEPREGSFSQLLGTSWLELIEVKNETPRRIFADRFWGDLGFIHLCFDIKNMDALKALCEANGAPFTVDSANSFDMGEAAGRFSYIEDPDGTLIEFVETHKLPLLKKLGWYLDLRKRDPRKPLPNWIFTAMQLNRIKD